MNVWLDYNNDGLFAHKERITMSEYNEHHDSYGTIKVPRNAVQDTLRLRIRNSYSTYDFAPCRTRAGEVEDYAVLVHYSNTDTNIILASCGEDIVFKDSVYNKTGQYEYTLINSMGCDSIIHLDLNIDSINTRIQVNNNELISSVSYGIYTWIDCLSDSLLIDQQSKIFQATKNGSYALIIQKGDCIDTTSCI